MKQNDLLFWIWLSEALGVGNSDFKRLMDLYESPYDLFLAESAELERIGFLSERTVNALSDKRVENAASIIDACERLGIGILVFSSELYPQPLREIRNPPIVLYYVGTVPQFDQRLSVGMVGTRRMSAYGMETAYKISYELAAAGAIVISGMAAGIDGVSAAAALRAAGDTVAVLGCGLDIAYPRHHGKLMNEIGKHGLLLSEYPPGTKPVYFHFPVRNRIISGLSHATVVVEAGLGSGSLITAKEAIVQGRDVFAIPANADGIGAEGANGLLRDGAIFATDASDIAARYQYLFATTFRTDRLREAFAHSDADEEYLKSMGVLESGFVRARQKPLPTVPSEPELKTESKKRSQTPPVPSKQPTQAPPLVGTNAALEVSDASAPIARETASESRPDSQTPDAILQSLSAVERAVLEAIPDDRSVTVDALGSLGYPYGEIITALTMLEIAGLVQKLPGALYTKA